jgi:CheY-like chemotaxis protein
MKPRALVVEDDDRIIGSIEDSLFSIGHEHDWVTNQHDAQEKLRDTEYTYVLLDLQIPAKPNRGGADKEFGCNLLKDIQQIKGPGRIPVIVMTGYSADCLDLSTELSRNGASDFISKPFSNSGRTLASVIRKVLGTHGEPMQVREAGTEAANPTARPFTGGEMVFHADRITLCDLTILVNSRARKMRKILGELRKRNSHGGYVARSGPELATILSIDGGQNSVAGSVRDFRENVTRLLQEQCGLLCQSQDIIRSGGPGYRLHEWISVRNFTDAKTEQPVPAATGVADAAVNERQQWIITELNRGRKLRTPDIATELRCSPRTIKRELDVLRSEGLIEFVGPSKTGHYQNRN